jgi:CubicO group peptidase (beta-lactamase class C family)
MTKSIIGRLISSFLINLTLLFSMVSPASLAAPDSQASVIPSSFFDPYSVGWASVRNMTGAQFSTHFDEMRRRGYFVLDIEVDEVDGVERVGAVWQKNLDGRGWAEYRDMTDQAFHDKWTELKDQGFRIFDQECYQRDNQARYAGAWIENKENLLWASHRNLTDQEFSSLFNDYSNRGLMMVDFDPCPLGSELRYAAIWVENVENLDWYEYRDMTSEEFANKFEELKGDYWIKDIESYQWGGQQYYAGIWVENKSKRAWYEYRDMTGKAFGDTWLQLRDAGYRLFNYERYQTTDGWRYAGVWRQNGIRPEWQHKDEVTALMQGYADQYELPGMAVAVAYQGQFVYLRGFGYADVDDNVIAHSRTLFRLASISKSVGGVLSMELSEKGLIDLGNDTSDYIAGLPVHHTHVVSQTVTNRSGIGDYDTYTTPPGHYDTALDAAKAMWDVPLEYTPGNGYLYSTHAYTFLGAAIEGALGQPIETVYENQLRIPFGLNSLRPEDRTVDHPFRSSLYNTDNDEVSADDLSWKRLGGGFESSVYDLARFGVMVYNGTILEADTLDLMWTAPDGFKNYGYGWDVGSDVVGKLGAQNGARAYLRIYPDDELVIVVMTNRKNGGHDPRIFCVEIADIILNNAKSARISGVGEGARSSSLIDDIEEPEMEFTDPALVIYPQYNPVAKPSPQDLQETDDVPVNGYQIYLSILTH